MKWTRAELDKNIEKDRKSSDYTGLPANTNTYRRAFNNLRQFMAQDSYMIASDRFSGKGRWGNFKPNLVQVKGLVPEIS